MIMLKIFIRALQNEQGTKGTIFCSKKYMIHYLINGWEKSTFEGKNIEKHENTRDNMHKCG